MGVVASSCEPTCSCLHASMILAQQGARIGFGVGGHIADLVLCIASFLTEVRLHSLALDISTLRYFGSSVWCHTHSISGTYQYYDPQPITYSIDHITYPLSTNLTAPKPSSH